MHLTRLDDSKKSLKPRQTVKLLPALKGEAAWPRKEFLCWTDDGNVAALS
jgi:hypothetical protein